MKLDRATLRWAQPAALMRLARALGIELRPAPRYAAGLDRWRFCAARTIAAVTCPEEGGAP